MTLGDMSDLVKEQAIDKAVEDVESFWEWNEANLKKRHSQFGKLAREVWGVPETP